MTKVVHPLFTTSVSKLLRTTECGFDHKGNSIGFERIIRKLCNVTSKEHVSNIIAFDNFVLTSMILIKILLFSFPFSRV